MTPDKKLYSPHSPDSTAVITIELSAVVYKRVAAAAKYSEQSVIEWVETMCDTATIH
jgi:hypothetical protein